MSRRPRLLGLASLALALAASSTLASPWLPVGPPGGDVRSLAVDPRNPGLVYLGTTDGILFRSEDAGQTWHRLEPGFPERGMSLDDVHVAPDGSLLVGYWEVQGSGGGVARSRDGGRSFTKLTGMQGRGVRGLAIAPSDPRVLVATTLDGVFRSRDDGESWQRLGSTPDHGITNAGSVAVDPGNPDVIYVGTWRLPWKTTDGGRSWRRIANGMIEDSDVMTLTVDRRNAQTVYATACTGIYRSRDGAGRWARAQGIPSSSRRTRAFAQDPEGPGRFYAGTTEGLWLSEDDTTSWRRITAADLVVNAIALLPGGTVLIGTDGAGVLRSADGGVSWHSSNQGFSARFVSRLQLDRERGRVLAVVQQDRVHAGVLVAPRLEGPWGKLAPGLEGREVLALATSGPDVLAGTDAGLFVSEGGGAWRRIPIRTAGTGPQPRVVEIAVLTPGTWLAATERGLLRTVDAGRSWEEQRLGLARAVTALLALDQAVVAATPLGLYGSTDSGRTWAFLSPGPPDIRVGRLVASKAPVVLFAGTPGGLFRSPDGGRSWWRCRGLRLSDITALAVSHDAGTVLAADFVHGGVFRSDDGGEAWSAVSTEGLVPDRVWGLLLDVLGPGTLVASTSTGGLHVLRSATGAPTQVTQ
jgi:photosystem II stability/assembly factor-like uncharacterized protein